MFRCGTRLTDLVHWVLKYANTDMLEYEIQFLQARTSDVAGNMQSFRFIQDASLFTSSCFIRVAKLSLENSILCTLILSRAKQCSSGHNQGLVNLD